MSDYPNQPSPLSQPPPVWGEAFPAQVEQFGRILDQVRGAALRAAVDFTPSTWPTDGELDTDVVLAVAARFEEWLVRDEEAP
jgi:hypothetical protein